MLSDLIFGPATTAPPAYAHYSGVAIRGRLIDIEAVREAIAAATQAPIPASDQEPEYELHPMVSIQVTSPGNPRLIGPEDLDGLDRVDRQNLRISVRLPEGSPYPHQAGLSVSIDMQHGRRTIVSASGSQYPNPVDAPVRDRVVSALTKDGTNLVPWTQLSLHLVFLPVVLMLTSWIMLIASVDLPTPAVVMGWTLIAVLVAGTVVADRHLAKRYADKWPGVIPRQESREKTGARRADHKRDAWVAALGVVGGLVLAALARAFGLTS